MISSIYKNRFKYYLLLKDFLDYKIKAYPFKEQFMLQRNSDINEDIKNGYYNYNEQLSINEQCFKEEYFDKLYNYTPYEDISYILREYVKGAEKYNISGDLFFAGIYDDLSVNIRDFYPRNLKEANIAGYDFSSDELGFPEFTEQEYEEEYFIDETELRSRVREKFNILEENKDRWC